MEQMFLCLLCHVYCGFFILLYSKDINESSESLKLFMTDWKRIPEIRTVAEKFLQYSADETETEFSPKMLLKKKNICLQMVVLCELVKKVCETSFIVLHIGQPVHRKVFSM